jgi:uncharacterized membrane protein
VKKPKSSKTSVTRATAKTVPKVEFDFEAEWSGPLPPPAALERFDQIIENGAERVMRQWESESQHRRELEKRELEIYGESELKGKSYALAFLVLAMAVCVIALYLNQPWVAAILGAGTIASVVWAFVSTNRD